MAAEFRNPYQNSEALPGDNTDVRNPGTYYIIVGLARRSGTGYSNGWTRSRTPCLCQWTSAQPDEGLCWDHCNNLDADAFLFVFIIPGIRYLRIRG